MREDFQVALGYLKKRSAGPVVVLAPNLGGLEAASSLLEAADSASR